MRVRLFAMVSVVSASAHADGPIEARVGAGATFDASVSTYANNDGDEYSVVGPSVAGDVGYRVAPELTLGVHLGLTRSWGTRPENVYSSADVTFTSFQVGLGVTYSIANRVWISPWLGFDERKHDERMFVALSRQHALGLGAGIDLWSSSATPHRLGAYAEIARSSREDDHDLYVSAGVMYRYR